MLDPPEPAPSILNMWPPLCCSPITRIASRVQIIDPTKFVETIYSINYKRLITKGVNFHARIGCRRTKPKDFRAYIIAFCAWFNLYSKLNTFHLYFVIFFEAIYDKKEQFFSKNNNKRKWKPNLQFPRLTYSCNIKKRMLWKWKDQIPVECLHH